MGPDLDRWRKQIAVAGGEVLADTVFANATIANVFTGQLDHGDIAAVDGLIAGIGKYANGQEVFDCSEAVVVPSSVDPHIHLESSLLWVPEQSFRTEQEQSLPIPTRLRM